MPVMPSELAHIVEEDAALLVQRELRHQLPNDYKREQDAKADVAIMQAGGEAAEALNVSDTEDEITDQRVQGEVQRDETMDKQVPARGGGGGPARPEMPRRGAGPGTAAARSFGTSASWR